MDEITNHRAKLVGAEYTIDRFGNKGNAVFLSGNKYTYINLGNYDEIKPKIGTISLWIKIEYPIWYGKGAYYNPIILTKNVSGDDFYEAYGIYYMLKARNLVATNVQDSTREANIFSKEEFVLNNWHHLVISYTYDNFKFYIDGELQATMPKKFETTFLGSDSVVLGTTANKKNERFLNASVDDVEFYDRALRDQEVIDLFHAPNPNKSRILLNRILLLTGILLVLLLIYFFVRYRVKSALKKQKEKYELNNRLLETELRVNRASMNPHFLFNSLNALHNLILAHENDNASDYLLKFSKLIRQTLDTNMSDSISLALEAEILQGYLEIENLRFEENVKYSISIDDSLVPSSVHIPIMMLQPFVENSIWHGLRNKVGEKIVSITFIPVDEHYVLCVIEDNGTGRKLASGNGQGKKSLATNFILQRLELLNKIKNLKCSLTIEDKPAGGGTIVKIILPILNKI
jgi:hypothetical protein